jgi:hypothetical protein
MGKALCLRDCLEADGSMMMPGGCGDVLCKMRSIHSAYILGCTALHLGLSSRPHAQPIKPDLASCVIRNTPSSSQQFTSRHKE